MPKIVGLDVGQGYAVAVCLDRFPVNIQQHFKTLRKNREFYKLKCDRYSVEKLLQLQPNAIVLEPSGYWYSAFWERIAKINDIEVCWIGHTDLAGLRKSYGFTNKRDDEDALSLAASYFDERFITSQGEKRYLKHYRSKEIEQLRSLFLAKEQLAKIRSGVIAQIKQRLSYEFPEMSAKSFKISPVQGFTPFLGWLAEVHNATRYDKLYSSSIARELGIEISQYTKDHAEVAIGLEKRIAIALIEIEYLLKLPEFAPYIEVFNQFGFGTNLKALLLLHIYPFDKFLVENKPHVEYELSKNDKLVKRHYSLRKFQAFLGLSYTMKQSGKDPNKLVRSFHGSTMMRSHLYIWAVCRVCPKDRNPLLSERYQQLRETTKGKDSIIRILFKVTRMLFYELNKRDFTI